MFPNFLANLAMATTYHLGPFRLDGEAGILFRDAEPVGLGQRAVTLLRVLVERAGAPVSKDALIEAGWPELAVEQSNLTVDAMKSVVVAIVLFFSGG